MSVVIGSFGLLAFVLLSPWILVGLVMFFELFIDVEESVIGGKGG